MRKLLAAALFAGFAMASGALPVAAMMVAPTTGQPGGPINTCSPANPVTPGNAATSHGSPFNPAGQAGNVYAGNANTASLTHSHSTATVSQYDAACVQLSH
jgi:hypothetical protein